MEINLNKRMTAFLCVAVIFSICYGVIHEQTSVELTSTLTQSTTSDNRADIGSKYVAITFDDGPKEGTTDILLQGLRERGVHATFFLIGKQIEENEKIIKQMAEDGHLIGNHTFNHVNLAQLSSGDACRELGQCFDKIDQVAYTPFHVIRPPYGELGSAAAGFVDCPVILWSVDTRDWTGKSAADIADYIVKNTQEGDIVLLHDIFDSSVYGALMAIDTMMENGYTFVTVDELFDYYGIILEPGKVYRKATTGG